MYVNNNAIHKNASNSSRSSSYNNSAFQRSPKFAIVRLSEGTDVLGLYQLLLENGYPEVSFVNEMRENAFLPYAMQNQTQPQHTHKQQEHQQQQNNERGNSLVGGRKVYLPMAVERKASFEAVRREQPQQHCPPPVHLQPQQFSPTTSTSYSRARPAAVAVIGKSPLGRASSSSTPTSNHFHNPSQRSTRSTTTNGIADDITPLFPALSATSPSSSSSSTGATNGVGVTTAAEVPPAVGLATASAGKKNDEYAVCLMCSNRIMSSRLSNLTNHVRRHASLKQYRCCHCQYSHNEMAKVRLHMSHNHQDFSSQPMDMLSFEMQLQWGLLMEQCFPEHSKRFGPSAANSQFRNLEELQKYVDMERSYTCIECGEVLTGYQLVNHLEDVHRQECVPFACGQCGYQSSFQWKVRLHISVKHAEKAAETTVATLPAGSNFMLFLQKFFAEVHIPVEEDETKLVAELQEKNSNNFLAMDALTDEAAERMEEESNEDNEKERNEEEGIRKLKSQSPLEDEERVMEDEEEEEEEGRKERRIKNRAKEERSQRHSTLLEDEAGNVHSDNDKLNIGKRVSSVRKRENSLTMEHEESGEQPMTKRHNLRHSNRLLMVAEKRNILSGNSSTATQAAIGTRKK